MVDVLLVFYAPWCYHCTALMPVLTKLAKTLEEEDISIVKYDATVNDVPKLFPLDGFPTIYLIRKDEKMTPVLFNERRNYDNLLKFITENSTLNLKSKNRKNKEPENRKEKEILSDKDEL
ncbi:protein disulfide-isomerase A4 [Eurytemora carolleeae]|uniref:protein disulfide-isomerase A4 n=1 Tax=Eurytemora carolleeae TaxID=1294199 RepID=UPI000C77F574|nr:protein disulfide-isomerase A4 [Eurytemora carolleeae]|eukprot:XP_023330414.1 protein disulfide-isomerase A4-like [Eurytemora affinis]